MSVQVTISVSDKDAQILRRNGYAYRTDSPNIHYRVAGLVREALPVLPMAGGKCQSRGAHFALGVRDIIYADPSVVIVRLGETWPSMLTATEFTQCFEVLS